MMRARLNFNMLPSFLVLSLLAAGCSDDASTDSSSGSESGESGTSGETSDSDSASGDGDGDTAGDGDGDTAGDGDGDPAGDGDGDTAGDGDGDTAGDGDGDGDTAGDGDGDDPPVEEGASCGGIVNCTQMCGNDLDCVAACVEEGSPSGAAEYDELLQCIVDNSCNNDNCIEANCGGELYACYTGDATCSDLLGCVGFCGGDPLCQASCYYEGSGLAQAQLEGLSDCDDANVCNGDDECLTENCGAEFTGCVGGGADTLPCPIVSECVLECGDEPGCTQECMPTTPEAQAEADELVACAEMNDCMDLDCSQQACPNEFVECISGDGSCADLIGCVVGCSGNELCEYNCVVEAGLMEQLVAGQLSDCAEQNNCTFDDADCLMANCAVEAIACEL